jgi:hypothetical protein
LTGFVDELECPRLKFDETCHCQTELDAEARFVAAQRRHGAQRWRWEVEPLVELKEFSKPIAGHRRWVFCLPARRRIAGPIKHEN